MVVVEVVAVVEAVVEAVAGTRVFGEIDRHESIFVTQRSDRGRDCCSKCTSI